MSSRRRQPGWATARTCSCKTGAVLPSTSPLASTMVASPYGLTCTSITLCSGWDNRHFDFDALGNLRQVDGQGVCVEIGVGCAVNLDRANLDRTLRQNIRRNAQLAIGKPA